MSDIRKLITEAAKKIGAIDKSGRNAQQGYSFRGIDTVMDKVGPVFHELGIICSPSYEIHSIDSYETKNGTVMREIIVHGTFAFTSHHAVGDTLIVRTIGQGVDSGDKAGNKAMAVALKYALLQALMIPVGDGDPDSETQEARSSRPAPTRSTPAPKPAYEAGGTPPHTCPSCGGEVDDKRASAKGKQPLWICSNGECQGGRARSKNPADGNFPWSSWDEWPSEWPDEDDDTRPF